ncbi:hypothetical protein ACFL3T_04265 [Patescibacteria group bacterium]
MPPKGPKGKLSAAEKIKFVNKHESTRLDEVGKINEKFNEIHKMTTSHDALAKALKIDKSDIDKYAKNSPKFARSLRDFLDQATVTQDKFENWFSQFMQNSRAMTTIIQAFDLTVMLQKCLKPLKEKTLTSFSTIKSGMGETMKQMVKNEQSRLAHMKYYTDMPGDIAKKFPKNKRAAIMQRIQDDPRFGDTLARMKFVPFEEFSKNFIAPKFIVTQRKIFEKIATEPLNPKLAEFANIRRERSRLKQQLLTLSPQAVLEIDDEFPKSWGDDVDINRKTDDNPWLLEDSITDAADYFNPNEEDLGNPLDNIGAINQNLSIQVEALKIMILSKNAEQELGSLHGLANQFTEVWEANGAKGDTWKLMLSYTGTPEKLFDYDLNPYQYFSPKESESIINSSRNSMLTLGEGIQNAHNFNVLKSALASLNGGESVEKWSLSNIDSVGKMEKALFSMQKERDEMIASRKEKKTKKHRA